MYDTHTDSLILYVARAYNMSVLLMEPNLLWTADTAIKMALCINKNSPHFCFDLQNSWLSL